MNDLSRPDKHNKYSTAKDQKKWKIEVIYHHDSVALEQQQILELTRLNQELKDLEALIIKSTSS